MRLILVLLGAIYAPFAFGQDELPARLALRDLENREQSLEAYRGKIVLVNFWATWCVPCRQEMPLLAGVQKQYEPRGVQVIAASADDEKTRQNIPKFVRRLKLNFPVWVGATVEDMQRLGLGSALPATLVVDRDGRIAGRILGVVDRADLEQRIEWLLGPRTGPPPPPVVNNFERAVSHAEEKEHAHAAVGIEGASTVPS